VANVSKQLILLSPFSY